ncbi:hypothetical protein GGX14DRAFT_568308 [Mycena pura]|uniref:Uncharacterized protein n=1 Tax=Mycena pura TaxID=153505 RepID=A0AAD6YCW8_9AGAR|nr:hypothetical protein GGX14DRAFT_568308 [Mycena pura]
MPPADLMAVNAPLRQQGIYVARDMASMFVYFSPSYTSPPAPLPTTGHLAPKEQSHPTKRRPIFLEPEAWLRRLLLNRPRPATRPSARSATRKSGALNGKCIAGWQVHARCGDLQKKRRHSARVHRERIEELTQGRRAGASQLEAREGTQQASAPVRASAARASRGSHAGAGRLRGERASASARRERVEELTQGRRAGAGQLEARESMQRGERRAGGTRVPGARVANDVVSSARGGDGEAVQGGQGEAGFTTIGHAAPSTASRLRLQLRVTIGHPAATTIYMHHI